MVGFYFTMIFSWITHLFVRRWRKRVRWRKVVQDDVNWRNGQNVAPEQRLLPFIIVCTMVENEKKHRIYNHLIIHCPMSEGARERANGRASGPVLTSQFQAVLNHSGLLPFIIVWSFDAPISPLPTSTLFYPFKSP